jgi:hypothetical protein
MEKKQNSFELDFKDEKIQVYRHSVGTQVIFRIQFSDKKPPLVITRATHANAYKFWTSIPEGRQGEAEELGAIISEYFKTIP